MITKRIWFANRRGEKLSGSLDLPTGGKPTAYGVLAHCFTCGKDLKPFVNMSRALCSEGIGVLRFDFTGIGKSGGDFSQATVRSNVEDLVDAARCLEAGREGARLLIGHSLGGIAALCAAKSLATVAAVVVIGSPADPRVLGGRLQRAKQDAERVGAASLALGGKTFSIRKRFFDDLESVDMKRVIPAIGKALLILHSPMDKLVGVENAGEIFRLARHPKSLVALPGADHLLLKKEDAMYAGKLIAAWGRYYF